MSDNWKYFPCQMGDDSASIFFDYGIHDTVDQLPTQLLRVHVPFKQPREDGMPTNAEADALFAIEDALQGLVAERKAYYVGRVTVGGQRHFQIYTPGSKDDWAPGLRDICNRFGYQLSFDLDSDPEHNGYRKDLYPTDDDWQVIADIGVLESLAKHGDDASAMHTIEHFAYFPSEAVATEFSNWLRELGYVVSRRSSNPDGQFCVEFTHQGTVRLPDISSHSVKLRRQAKKMGGNYDGWGTLVCKPGD
jgi:regulator of RNase E activity RraB